MILRKSGLCLLFTISILLLIQSVTAQSQDKPYYNFRQFTVTDGLSTNGVNYLCKDSRGFLWIGTKQGLQRFNGSSFINYRHFNNDSNSIVNDRITFITEDRNHDIWVATNSGISKFNYSNGKFINYLTGWNDSGKISMGDLFWLLEDSRGRLWAGGRSGLFLFNVTRNRFENIAPKNIPGMSLNHFIRVSSIKETINKEIVFSVVDGFVIIDKDGNQQYFQMPVPGIKEPNHIPTNQVMVLKDYPEEVWVTANLNGLYKYEKKGKRWTHYMSGGILHADLILKGCLEWNTEEWLFGADNVCFFNHRTGKFRPAFDKEKVKQVSCILREPNGVLWISTSMKGLLMYNPATQLFTSLKKNPAVFPDKLFYYDDQMNAVYGMNIYNATGIIKLDLRTNTLTKDSISIFKPYVTILNNYLVDDDVMYIAMEKGFWKYDLRKHTIDSIVFGEGTYNSQKAFFFNLVKSPDKIFVTGKFGKGGPFMYDKMLHTITDLQLGNSNESALNDGIYYPDNYPSSGIPHGQVNTEDLPLLYKKIIEPPIYSFSLTLYNHYLYVGMNVSDSIYVCNESGLERKAIEIPSAYRNGKPSSILSLCADTKQQLWCGTANQGIFIYSIRDKKWIRHIEQQDGYFPLSTSEIVCDEDGVVWCNTSEGLYRFNTNNFQFKRYGVKDGLAHENNGGNLVVLPSHKLLYNNIDLPWDDYTYGIINTKPADTNVVKIPISITDLTVLGKPFLADTLLDNINELILPPLQNAFSLSYAGISLTEGKELQYAYWLEGAESDWQHVKNEQRLSYINLSPGQYKLHITCKTRDGLIMSQERILIVKLLPAWYQTTWFKILLVLLLIGILFSAVRYYLKQQLKKQYAILEKERALESERQRIAADMHDDVGAGLSRIRYITAGMKDQNSMKQEDIDRIVSLSDESVEKMNEIIWALNQGNQQLEEILYFTRSQCSEMISNAGIEFSFLVPDIIPAKTMAWKDCRNIYLLVKEAVNNAIKHSSAKKISIEFEISNNLLISIHDNGIGFNAMELLRQGNGLFNYKKRVESLKGTYSINSSTGNGTTIRFEIPLVTV
jgi:signal transduction histidine kinase/frataxin-like iron-binding protein CyaY